MILYYLCKPINFFINYLLDNYLLRRKSFKIKIKNYYKYADIQAWFTPEDIKKEI